MVGKFFTTERPGKPFSFAFNDTMNRFLASAISTEQHEDISIRHKVREKAEGQMLLLQYFGNPMRTADSLEKSLMLGKIDGRRRRPQRMRGMDGMTDAMDMNLGKFGER